MVRLVFGYSSLQRHGVWRDFRFDDAQRLELLLTLLQSGLAVLLLANMEFDWLDATIIFVLWLGGVLPAAPRGGGAVAFGVWVPVPGVGFVGGGAWLAAAEA